MHATPAPLLKRFAAIIYDLFLVTAVVFIVGIIVATITTFAVNNGHAITEDHSFYWVYQIYLLSSLLLSAFMFFAWFWTHGGQTLGMKTWKLQMLSDNQQNITWKQSAIRFFSAGLSWGVLGIGFLSCLWHDDKKTWHDLLSKSRIVERH